MMKIVRKVVWRYLIFETLLCIGCLRGGKERRASPGDAIRDQTDPFLDGEIGTLQSGRDAPRRPKHVSCVACAEVDRKRNNVETRLPEHADGTGHMISRRHEKPVVLWHWIEHFACKDCVLICIARRVLDDDALW